MNNMKHITNRKILKRHGLQAFDSFWHYTWRRRALLNTRSGKYKTKLYSLYMRVSFAESTECHNSDRIAIENTSSSELPKWLVN